MTHTTPAREEAKGLKQRAGKLARQARTLEGLEGAAQLAGERQAEAAGLQEQARKLGEAARLEDLTVWEDCIVKKTKKGEKKYGRWMAGWREGDRVRKVYLGSCKRMSQAEALTKARAAKAKALRTVF